MTTHHISLTRGAANRLGQLAATPGLLKDQQKLFRIGSFAEAHLADLPPAPMAPAREAPATDHAAWQAGFVAWLRESLPPIEVNDRARDALRDLLHAACEAGVLSASGADTALQRALGFAPED